MIGGGGRSSDCGARARINSFTIDLSIAIISYLKKVARVAARHWVGKPADGTPLPSANFYFASCDCPA
jgi:hypothetical protein